MDHRNKNLFNNIWKPPFDPRPRSFDQRGRRERFLKSYYSSLQDSITLLPHLHQSSPKNSTPSLKIFLHLHTLPFSSMSAHILLFVVTVRRKKRGIYSHHWHMSVSLSHRQILSLSASFCSSSKGSDFSFIEFLKTLWLTSRIQENKCCYFDGSQLVQRTQKSFYFIQMHKRALKTFQKSNNFLMKNQKYLEYFLFGQC